MSIPGRWLIVVAAFLLAGPFVFADEPVISGGRFEVRSLSGTDQKYVVYLPPGYSKDKRWPVILFLHGAGERGHNPLSPTYAGLGPVLRHSPGLFPAIAVFPQCESWDDRIYTSWEPGSVAGELAMRVLGEVEQTESIDPAHRILTGWSMGGFGATAWAEKEPEKWSTVLAISGGHEGEIAASLTTRPLWIIHGDQDAVVAVERSRQLAQGVSIPGTLAKYDEVPGAGHEVWERVYSDPRVAKWLMEGGEHPRIDWSIPPTPHSLPTSDDIAPFVPAATVSHALAMRIGNDALKMLSAGIPESVRPERLQGPLDDIRESLTVDGQTYHLALNGLTYKAQLESTELTCHSNGEIDADLGVSLELRISQASLTTTGFSARTGGFRIVIGHRRPVPLCVRIAPTVEAEKLRLHHRDTTFPIPDDDWYVEIPKQIDIEGNKFTRHEIETGIVGGLYTRKADVEEQVRSVIPPLLQKVEQRLNLDTSGELTRWLWPFPVYQPRLRWKAESISVDARGMSVQLGAIIAANAPEKGAPLREHSGAARLSPFRAVSRDLHLVVDPKLIEGVSEEFALSGVARINVLDLSESRFHTLADATRLRAALPQLPAAAEVRSVLSMTGPFRYSGQSQAGHSQLQLTIPDAGLEVFARTESGQWSPAARLPIQVEQKVAIDLAFDETGPPQLGVQWSASPRVSLTAPSNGDRSGTAALESELLGAWTAWAGTRNRPASPTNDFVLGDSRLRLTELQLESHLMSVGLNAPFAQLRVTGSRPLRFRIRPRGGTWQLPQTVAPGDVARWPLTDVAQWQEIGAWGEVNAIGPGQVIEWNSETGVKSLFPASATTPTAMSAATAR